MVPILQHTKIGSLLFDPLRKAWIGFVALPAFAGRSRVRSSASELSVEDILTKLKSLRNRISFVDDAPLRTAQEEFENWYEEPTSRGEVQNRVWERWMRKLELAKRHEGLLAVQFFSPDETAPGPIQDNALELLLEQQQSILKGIQESLVQSCEAYDCDPACASAAQLTGIVIHEQGLNNVAAISFEVECEWEASRNMYVVYHPGTGYHWANADGVDELLLESSPPQPAPPPPTAEEELVTAILMNDRPRQNKLLAQGIRAEPASGSALFGAIHERNDTLVRQLLHAGANPNRTDSYEGTPLQAAHRALAEAKLTLPRKAAWWMKAIVLIPRVIHSRKLLSERRKAEAIISMLKQAGAQ